MILRKKYESGFAIVPNFVILDERLTNTDKVVLLYLCSRPETWVVNNNDIMKVANIKTRHKMADVWNRLIKYSFIVRRERKDNGKFQGFDLELFPENELPCADNQHTAPCAVSPHAVLHPIGENNTLNKKEIFNKKEKEKKKDIVFSDFIKNMADEMRSVLRKHFGHSFVDMCPDGATVEETMIKFAEYWHYQKGREWDNKNQALKKAIISSFEQWNPIHEANESHKVEVRSELNSDLFLKIVSFVDKYIPDMSQMTAEELVEFKKFLDGDGAKFVYEDWIEHIKDLRDGSGRNYSSLIKIAKTRLRYL